MHVVRHWEVAMLANVSKAHYANLSIKQCVTGPLRHMSLRHSRGMYLTLFSQQNPNGAALESWWFVVDHELRCQFLNYYDIQ